MLTRIQAEGDFLPLTFPETTVWVSGRQLDPVTSPMSFLQDKGTLLDPRKSDPQEIPGAKTISWSANSKPISMEKSGQEAFIKDTYSLIRHYGNASDPDYSCNIQNFTPLAAYCHKYGVPLVLPATEPLGSDCMSSGRISYGDLLSGFRSLFFLLRWEKIFKPAEFVDSILYASKEAVDRNMPFFRLLFQPPEGRRFNGWRIAATGHNEIQWLIAEQVDNPRFFPRFSVPLSAFDLAALIDPARSTEEKMAVLRRTMRSNVTDLLNDVSPMWFPLQNSLAFAITNPLLLFLTMMLFGKGPKPCMNPKCSNISMKGNDYCCPRCKTEFHNNSPRGKMGSLLGKWMERKQISLAEYDYLHERGMELINQGFDWPSIKSILTKIRSGDEQC